MGKGKEGVKTTPEDRGEKGTAGGRRDAEEVAKSWEEPQLMARNAE